MKTTVIIGAVKPGYSQAITRKMISEGVYVIGTFDKEYTSEAQKLKEEYSEEKLLLKELDLLSTESMKNFVNSIDAKIDGLVFAQFYFSMEDPENFNYEMWDKSIAVNLSAPNYLIRELSSRMNSGSSNIIITSSEAYRGSYGASAYSASKAAIHNLVKSLANILGKKSIRVNALPSGWIGGEMDTDEIFNKSRELTPIGRLGYPEEIANVVFFLFSEQSSFINGTALVTDGGYIGSDPLAKYEFDHNSW